MRCVARLGKNTRSARIVLCAIVATAALVALNTIHVDAQHTGSGSLGEHAIDYWWIAITQGDLVLLSVEADTPFTWTSDLYYANLTLIQTVSDDFTHNYQFYANATGDYLLKLSSGYYSFNYTVECAHMLSEQPAIPDVVNPIADAGSDQTVFEGSAVIFDAGDSSDNVGIISYEWDFGDGTSSALEAGPITTHTYTELGTYNVTLTVKDVAGNQDSHSIAVVVLPSEILRESPPIEVVAQAAVVSGVLTSIIAALSSLESWGQAFNSVISKLPIPDEVKGFLKIYGKALFETVDKKRLRALERAPFTTKGEVAALGISAILTAVVYSFVEVNGLPFFLSLSVLVTVIPSTLLSVCLVCVAGELFEALGARVARVYRRFSLWPYGLGLFLISGLLFLFPLSSPGITRYQSAEISNDVKGLLVLSKLLILLSLTIPFTVFVMLGFKTAGDAGLLLTLMKVFYSLIPLKPLAGKAVFDYRKDVLSIALASTGAIFLLYVLVKDLVPLLVYPVVGMGSLVLAAVTFRQLQRLR